MARPLKENADYFSHDNDMRDNPRIKALRAKHGLVGYAIYCMMLEVLTKADKFTIQVDELTMEILGGDFGIDAEELERIIDSFRRLKLFDPNAEYIKCPALIERMQPLQDSRDRKRRWIDSMRDKKANAPGVLDVHNPVIDDNATSKTHKVKIKESKDKDKDKVDDDVNAHTRTTPPPPPPSKIFDEKKVIENLTEKTAVLLGSVDEGSLSLEKIENFRAHFSAEMAATGKTHENEADLVRHFVNWVRKRRISGGGAAGDFAPNPAKKRPLNDITLEPHEYKRKQIF